VQPEFIHEGNKWCCLIPGDAPNIKSAKFPTIKAIDGTKEEGEFGYDQSSEAQEMMKAEGQFDLAYFTHISIPFSSSSSMKGAYICLWDFTSPPSHLIITLTSSKGEKTSKKYEFPEFRGDRWYFLPVDLPDVVLCEITGKGRWRESFEIHSLVFISRDETPEEITSREAREKLWSEAPIVKSEFVKEGWRDSIPIPRDDPKLVDPSFSMVKCKDDSVSKESEYYDQSSDAQKMLKGEDDVDLSHLSIPFPSPSPMKGAYICVNKNDSSPSLLFTFTDCDGKKTFKKYEFTRPEYYLEWDFLPIDLDNVVLCEIEGKGRWRWEQKNSRYFYIYSLVFTMPEETIAAERLSLLPWKYLTPVSVPSSSSKTPTSTLSLPSKPVKEAVKEEEEEEEIVIKGNDKFCVGGSVSAFAKRWCADGKYVSVDDTADDSEPSDSDSDSDSSSSSGSGSESADVDTAVPDFDAMTLNPVKVCSLCVGMIECLDDVFTAKPKLVHRDVKPDNFLVRVDPDSKKCTVVLADLGFVQIQDSVSSSRSS
ncbi:hypothetical protein ADUPG1_010975, partial [Aduncisulcus paluster]